MNYMAGPLSRTQIPALNQLAGASAAVQTSVASSAPRVSSQTPAQVSPRPVTTAENAAQAEAVRPAPAATGGFPASSTTRPSAPAGAAEYVLPNTLTFTQAFEAAGRSYPPEAHSLGLIYRPAVLAQATVRFLNRKYNLDYEMSRAALALKPDRRGAVRWEQFLSSPFDPDSLDGQPDPQARFASLEAPLNEGKLLSAMQKDFVDWAYRSSVVTVRANEALKVYAGPEVSQGEFRQMCSEAARQGRDAELRKLSDGLDRKIRALQTKLDKEERELGEDESELSQRRMEEYGTHAENVLSLFTKRRGRRLTTSLSKRRMTEQAKADVEESRQAIKAMEQELIALDKEKEQALAEINARWSDLANQEKEIQVAAAHKDVLLDVFGVAWAPYYVVQVGGEVQELEGFSSTGH